MKNFNSLFCLVSLMALAACGDGKKNSSRPASRNNSEPVASPLSFNFKGLDKKGKACSTGAKSFSTIHLMCIGLQNPENDNCALDERTQRFQQECEPQGYAFNESINCRLGIVAAGVEHEEIKENPKTGEIVGVDFCVGYAESGTVLRSLNIQQAVLKEGVRVDVKMNFSTHETPHEDSMAEIAIYHEEKNGSGYYGFKRLNFSKGLNRDQSISGNTGEEKLVMTCEKVWACASPRQ